MEVYFLTAYSNSTQGGIVLLELLAGSSSSICSRNEISVNMFAQSISRLAYGIREGHFQIYDAAASATVRLFRIPRTLK